MKYRQEQNKVRKIWEYTNYADKELKINDNEIKKIFLKNNNILPSIIIDETDWLSVSMGEVNSAMLGVKVEDDVDISYNKILNLPEYLLPYVDISVQIKNSVDSSILRTMILPEDRDVGYWYDSKEYWRCYTDGTKVAEVRTNNNLTISAGDTIESSHWLTYKYSENEDENEIISALYKAKAFKVIVYYETYEGTKYKMEGYLAGLTYFVTYQTHPLIYYECNVCAHGLVSNPNPTSWFNGKYHQITSLNNSLISFVGKKYWEEWVWNPSAGEYIWETRSSEPESFEGNLSETPRYILRVVGTRYIWNEAQQRYVWDSSPTHAIAIEKYEVTSMTTCWDNDYWVFWDSYLNWNIASYIPLPYNYEGSDKPRREMVLLPEQIRDLEGINTLRWERFYNDKPDILSSLDQETSYTDKNHYFYKISSSDSNKIKFHLRLNTSFIRLAPTVEETTPIQIPVYNDYFTWLGSSWGASENHSVKDIPVYKWEAIDILYKIKVKVSNPLYYNEIRKHSK